MNDFIINTDLEIENGDLKIDDSDNQNIYAILKAYPGQFREHPLLGCGVQDMVNGAIDSRVERRKIRNQIRGDGYKIYELSVVVDQDDVQINVNAVKVK